MTPAVEHVPASVGEIVTVTVPNWASAGFRWSAHFDGKSLEEIDHVATAGDDTVTAGIVSFRFRLLAADASLELTLSRPGQGARQTNAYRIGVRQHD
ncbi:protease inhibitor I42 family protein [Hansschlegelia quercus]|uniref:Proteinase inhibitor I42 chagasin domain-containing protein n=1 Tax=Hansschlegelia quercus TaxID=2528245 RepID=A0A4Q9GHE4_9HYPH|nr:protease inhibitor I42 family protein [Hansschlegelia quercus]TBN53573.1 hypothetical protein EYR15_07080 [Hansschlegelia quercus]